MIGQTFRVWDKRYKQYVKPYAVCLDGRAIVITEPCNDLETLDSERAIIEFGTGIKDKNGKEICEGDILDDGVSHIGNVFFNQRISAYVFEFVVDDNIVGSTFIDLYTSDIEIIGNIHENPELLGGKE